MAYQTYINGEIKPTIVYAGKSENDGYLPTAVYVNGELITPLSAVEDTVNADGAVEAYTEYEKALKSVTVTGTTYQANPGDILSSELSYFTDINNYIDTGITSIWEIPFPSSWVGKELTFKLTEKVKMQNITFDVSDGGGLFANTQRLLDTSGNLYTVTSNAYSYFRFTGVLVDNLQLISDFWNNYKVEVLAGVSPIFPQPIENANDSGMSVSLHGDNLFDQDATVSDSNFTKAEYEGFDCVKIKPTTSVHQFPCHIPKGTYFVNFDYIGTSTGAVSFDLIATYENGTNQFIGGVASTLDPVFTFRNFAYTKTATMPIVSISFRFYNIPVLNEYYFKNIMVNTGSAKPYQPYFNKQVTIPASVEVDGTIVDLRFGNITSVNANGVRYTANDYLTVDGANKKVLYHQNLGKETLTSDMNWGILTYNEKKYFWLRRNIGAGYNGVVNLSDKYQGMIGVGAIMKYDFGITADCGWYGSSWRNVVSVRDTRFDNLEDFLADMTENPIEFEYGLLEEIPHDITNTDLGQSLLALALKRNATNILEISSNPNAPLTPINLTYYKWGGRNANNNNT